MEMYVSFQDHRKNSSENSGVLQICLILVCSASRSLKKGYGRILFANSFKTKCVNMAMIQLILYYSIVFKALWDRNGLSIYSRTSQSNHRKNTLKPCLMTISVFR